MEAQYKKNKAQEITASEELMEPRNNYEDFESYNFKNKLEIPIPNNFELSEEDSESVLFKIRKDQISEHEAIKESFIAIELEPETTNFSEETINKITSEELDKYLISNENGLKPLLNDSTFQGYEIEKSTIQINTTSKNYNYIGMTFYLKNKDRKAEINLLLIPFEGKTIRVLTTSFPENFDEFNKVISKINIL